MDDLWWRGPEFLRGDPHSYIEKNAFDKNNVKDDSLEEQIKMSSSVLIEHISRHGVDDLFDCNRNNSFLKTIRITAYVMRFVNNLKLIHRKKEKIDSNENVDVTLSKYLTTDEMNAARKYWIKRNQIILKNSEKYDDLRASLNIMEDEDGILRSFGRLRNAKVPYDTKAPIMISKDHGLAESLVRYCHLKVLHRGVTQTLTELRSSYWITRGRQFVKKILHPCTLCRKLNARAYKYPESGDLPSLRFDTERAFVNVGVDYLGPLYVLPVYGQSEDLYKCWVVLYTCATTRAIILDVVHNYTASCFVNCFSRFISRRGCPNTMLSDNGTPFIAAETQRYASNKMIRWKFNVEGAPWWGGLWERLVKCVKGCIKKVVGVKRLTFVELETLILEVEVILNNRPLCPDYEDDMEDALTPNHLVFGRRIDIANEMAADEKPNSVMSNERIKLIRQLLQHFWRRWSKEYVTLLRQFHGKIKGGGAVTADVGDIVIIFDEKLPRHLWKLGRVTKLLYGRDNRVRAVELKTGRSNNTMRRPVNRLYPIEVARDTERLNEDSVDGANCG